VKADKQIATLPGADQELLRLFTDAIQVCARNLFAVLEDPALEPRSDGVLIQ